MVLRYTPPAANEATNPWARYATPKQEPLPMQKGEYEALISRYVAGGYDKATAEKKVQEITSTRQPYVDSSKPAYSTPARSTYTLPSTPAKIEAPVPPVTPTSPIITRAEDGSPAVLTSPLDKLKSSTAFLDAAKEIIQRKQGYNKDISKSREYWEGQARNTFDYDDPRLRELSPSQQANMRLNQYSTAQSYLGDLRTEEEYRGARVDDMIDSLTDFIKESKDATKEDLDNAIKQQKLISDKKKNGIPITAEDLGFTTEAITRFDDGATGGQCGTFTRRLVPSVPPMGDTIETKRAMIDNYGISAEEWRTNPQVGDVLIFKTRMPEGHAAVVNAVNSDGTVTLTESNWKGDEKVTNNRKLDLNNPNIYGAYRTSLQASESNWDKALSILASIPDATENEKYLALGKADLSLNETEKKAIIESTMSSSKKVTDTVTQIQKELEGGYSTKNQYIVFEEAIVPTEVNGRTVYIKDKSGALEPKLDTNKIPEEIREQVLLALQENIDTTDEETVVEMSKFGKIYKSLQEKWQNLRE